MSVGGKLIETVPTRLEDGRLVVRLWVIATNAGGPGVHDELCVYAEPQDDLPSLGDNVWWQGGKIYFDGERRHLRKLGYSFSPNDHMDAA